MCEPDEYAKLVEEIKTSGIVGDNWKGIFKQKRTFTGKALVTYLVTKTEIGNKLLRVQVVAFVQSFHLLL